MHVLALELPRLSTGFTIKSNYTDIMSSLRPRKGKHNSKQLMLTHTWLNLSNEHMTTGRINQIEGIMDARLKKGDNLFLTCTAYTPPLFYLKLDLKCLTLVLLIFLVFRLLGRWLC